MSDDTKIREVTVPPDLSSPADTTVMGVGVAFAVLCRTEHRDWILSTLNQLLFEKVMEMGAFTEGSLMQTYDAPPDVVKAMRQLYQSMHKEGKGSYVQVASDGTNTKRMHLN